jgi:arsenate reductase (thioredoxin)
MTKRKLRLLFLCTGNSCRSQMAEGWARALKPELIEPFSAGVVKHGMNETAVTVMAEAGVDISGQHSKTVDELPTREFDVVITLCGHAEENCPYFPGKARRLHRGFDDPPALAARAGSEEEALVHYRRVRDEIRDFVAGMPENLNDEGQEARD